MTLTFSALKSEIKRHLSIIGKRMYAKSGENMFSNVTVSTAEDPIFDQYIASAAESIEAMLRQLITSYSLTSTTVSMTLTNTRGASDFDARCQELIKSYIVHFAVCEYLGMTHPELYEKYQMDVTGAMHSLLSYSFYKNPPSAATASPLSIETSVS